MRKSCMVLVVAMTSLLGASISYASDIDIPKDNCEIGSLNRINKFDDSMLNGVRPEIKYIDLEEWSIYRNTKAIGTYTDKGSIYDDVKYTINAIEGYDEDSKNKNYDYARKDSSRIITENYGEKVDKENGKYKYPESAVVLVKVYAAKDNGDGTINSKDGTGVLIGPDTVLTCAHIFFEEYNIKGKTGKKTLRIW